MEERTKPLKYIGYAFVCAEVPDEISLAFNVSGCPHKCNGCHSQYLWRYEGKYLGQDLKEILPKNKPLISCICFMGGDQNIKELYDLCRYVKDNGLKTCVYSGAEDINVFSDLLKDNLLDYLKIGRYDDQKGGLNNPATNQIMYQITNGKLENINYKFQKPKF